jgi:hypothetical protein
MDRKRVLTWAVALGLAGASSAVARAGTISATTPVDFTGKVATDFATTNPGSLSLSNVVSVPGQSPSDVYQAPWIAQSGWTNGWVMKGEDFHYDKATDTMYVGVGFYSVAGNATGNGTPGVPDPRQAAVGGTDEAHLGGMKSITVAFAPAAPGETTGPTATPVIVAGVPQDKTKAGTGVDGFTVSKYAAGGGGIETSYGTALAANTGTLAFDPSKAHPDFEFTIKNFSKIAGLNGTNGFWVETYAGSPTDVIAGEGHLAWTKIPAIPAGQIIPEPTTLAAWALLVGGAGWALRRSRRRADHQA